MDVVLGLAAGGVLLFGAVNAEGAGAEVTAVDTALVLAGDVSGSMSSHERQTQRDGLAAALRDPEVMAAIHLGAIGRVAVTYIEWAGPAEQWRIVPWTIIGSWQAADAFAASLAQAPAVTGHLTSLSAGLLFAARQFWTSGVTADREVIDVSGDGPSNAGPSVAAARDVVVAEGITINGLPLSDTPDDGRYGFFDAYSGAEIARYYETCVIGGPGAFVMPVTDPERYSAAMLRKLVTEIAMQSARVVPAGFMMKRNGWSNCDAAE